MLIVCDIDGVLAEIDDELRKNCRDDDIYYSMLAPTKTMELIKCLDQSKLIFLTGRYEKHRKTTLYWLQQCGFDPSILIMYPDEFEKSSCHAQEVIEYKAKMLNLLHADFYIEDIKEIADKLKQLCPRTVIVCVGDE